MAAEECRTLLDKSHLIVLWMGSVLPPYLLAHKGV